MQEEDSLILLEIGARIKTLEKTVEQLCQTVSLMTPMVQLQSEIEYRRVKKQNGKL